jgi:hypothetical protein
MADLLDHGCGSVYVRPRQPSGRTSATMIPLDRVRDHVADLARRLASIEVGYVALTVHFDPTEQSAGFAELRGEIERARLHAEGLAATMRVAS